MLFTAYVWPFLVYWLILFVVSYIVVEYGQYYLYDEATPGVFGKVALGALILAAILTKTRTSFDTMFTANIASTVILAIAWSGVFIFVSRFHPWHGFGLAIATLLIFAGMASLVVSSMLDPKPPGRMDMDKEYKTIRKAASGASTPPPSPAPSTTPAPAK